MEPDKTDIEVMVRSASVALDTAMRKEKRNVKKQRSWTQRSKQRRSGDRHIILPEDEVVLDSEHSWTSSGGKAEGVIVSIDETKKGLRRSVQSTASSVRSGDPSDVMSMATERVKNGRHRNAPPPTHFAEPSTPKRCNSGRQRPTYTMAETSSRPTRSSASGFEPALQSQPSNVTSGSESARSSCCESEASSSRRSSGKRFSGGNNKGFFKMLKRGMKNGKKRKNKKSSVEVDWGRDGRTPTAADDILKDLQRNANVVTTPPRSNRRADKRSSIQKTPSGGSGTSGEGGGGGQTTEKKKLKLKVRNKTSQSKAQQAAAAAVSAAAASALLAATSSALVPMGVPAIQEEKKAEDEDDHTLDEVQNNPAGVLSKAIRYRRKAEKLLQDVTPASQIPKGSKANNQLAVVVHVQPPSGMDARDAHATARKAYKYATEARRLYKLVKEHKEQLRMERQFQNGVNPDESWEQIRARLLSENGTASSPPVIEIGDEFAVQRVVSEESKLSDARSTFSERLELEEHQRKMNELSLFSTEFNFSFMPTANNGGGDSMSKDQYTRETIAILQQFEDDELSVASPLSFASGDVSVVSNVTTKSEQELRVAHQKAMEELELFTTPSLPTSPLPGPPTLDTRALSRTVSQSIAQLSTRVQSNYLEIAEKGQELVYGQSSSSESEGGGESTSRVRIVPSTDASTGVFSDASGGVRTAPSQDTGTVFSYTSGASQETGQGTGTSQTSTSFSHAGRKNGRGRRNEGPTTLAKRFLMTRQVTPEKDKYALAPDREDDDIEDDTTVETGLEMPYDIHRFGIVRSAEESSTGSVTDEETGTEYSDEFSDEHDSCSEDDDEDYSSQYTDDPGTEGEDSTTLAGEESTVYTDQEDDEEESVASSRSSGEDDDDEYSSDAFSDSSQSLSTRAEERRRRISRRMRRLKKPKTMGEKLTTWITTLGAS